MAPSRRLFGLLATIIAASVLLMHLLSAWLLPQRKARTNSLHGLAVVQEEPSAAAAVQYEDGGVSASIPARRIGHSPAPSTTGAGVSRPAAEQQMHTTLGCELLFAIPTVARPNANNNYLNITLEALLCQLPPFDVSPRVCIGVFEPRRPPAATYTDGLEQPTPFELARVALSSRPEARSRVLFVRPPAVESAAAIAAFAAAERAANGRAVGSKKVPRLGATKRQTVDVARMLLALQPHASSYLVLMEDDWLLCDGGMDAIRYLLAKASIYRPDWAALRFSYGLNGILLPSADLSAFAAFLLDPAAEPDNNLPDAPVDHLAYRWLRGKYTGGKRYFGSRRIVAFRHSLFWHIGDASAIGNLQSRHKPKCYGVNKEWLFEQESFHTDECADDDVWPCTGRPREGSDAAKKLAELAQVTAEHAPGAEACDAYRVCWGRPTGERTRGIGDGGRKCASRLQCRGAGGQAPCVPTEPEYSS